MVNSAYPLTDFGYLRILPPGTKFIIGGILDGTDQIEQICDNFKFVEKALCPLPKRFWWYHSLSILKFNISRIKIIINNSIILTSMTLLQSIFLNE